VSSKGVGIAEILEVLISTNAIPDTTVRVGGHRVWTVEHLTAIRKILEGRKSQEQAVADS
jgi:hypothetical protein